MNKAKVANIDGLTKPELDYLCEHDYIKIGDKYYISKERAIELVAQLQANDADTGHDKFHIQRISNSVCLAPKHLRGRCKHFERTKCFYTGECRHKQTDC